MIGNAGGQPTVSRIGVVGAGQMGSGIAQTAARSGSSVLLADLSAELAERGWRSIADQLAKQVAKGKLDDAERGRILERIQVVPDLEALAEADFVIEAINEDRERKFAMFRELDRICRSEAILTSNTSSISITRIAAQTRRPEQVAGMHFMNPVPVMKLVEGVRGLQTSDPTFQTVRLIAERMDKVFIEARDVPGFCVNRILMPMINEAVYALYENIASVEDIDQAMTLGTNQPMGPLTLADFIGLDTCLAIMETLREGFGDSKYRPCPLLKQYVDAGWLGRKSGRGFRVYR